MGPYWGPTGARWGPIGPYGADRAQKGKKKGVWLINEELKNNEDED